MRVLRLSYSFNLCETKFKTHIRFIADCIVSKSPYCILQQFRWPWNTLTRKFTFSVDALLRANLTFAFAWCIFIAAVNLQNRKSFVHSSEQLPRCMIIMTKLHEFETFRKLKWKIEKTFRTKIASLFFSSFYFYLVFPHIRSEKLYPTYLP